MAARDQSGHRRYSESDIAWFSFIKRLKDTGMPLKEIREYARLRYQGDSTLEQRLAILEQHKLAVIEEKNKWEQNLLKLDEKIAVYQRMIAEAALRH